MTAERESGSSSSWTTRRRRTRANLASILETKNFGTLGFVEIGALSVGRIVQVHPTDRLYARGEEKSLFRFGGSAIAVFGQAGAWRPWDDVLENTRESVETFLRLGDPVARCRH